MQIMKHEAWLKKNVDAAPYGTKKRLAKHMGIDSTKLSRILSGQRELKIEEMEKAAEFFHVPPYGGKVAYSASMPTQTSPEDLGISPALAEEAEELGLDWRKEAKLGASERVTIVVKNEKERLWKEDNRAAIEAANAWVEAKGLPLAKHRPFRVG